MGKMLKYDSKIVKNGGKNFLVKYADADAICVNFLKCKNMPF